MGQSLSRESRVDSKLVGEERVGEKKETGEVG